MIPEQSKSGQSTTAAAKTGPARHPRPTSSMPATCENPNWRQSTSRQSSEFLDCTYFLGVAAGVGADGATGVTLEWVPPNSNSLSIRAALPSRSLR